MRPIEVRNKISESCKRNGIGKWMLGRKRSEETKRKISLNHRHFQSLETKRKISEINKGRKLTEEQIRRLSIAKTGKKHPHSEEHIRNQSGENHYNWQGGKSFEPYPLGWTKTHKEQIRFRDRYRCQICGVSEIECIRKLAIHHIDYNKMNIEPNNLIALCVSCHIKTNYNKNYWLNYFTKKENLIEIRG